MSQLHRVRGRIAVLASASVAALAFAVPTAASAADLTETDWTLRSGWVSYISNPLWKNAQPITTSWAALGGNTYGIPVDAPGSSTDVRLHQDDIRFDVDLHDIHITIGNLELTRDPADNAVVVEADVTYDPVVGADVSDRREILTLDLDDAAAVTPISGGDVYEDVPAYLTSGGAAVFNGGSNGSYAQGQQFGDLSVAFP